MGICRILGLIGSATVLGCLVYVLFKGGFDALDEPHKVLLFIAFSLVAFNFVPVSSSYKDSLLSLWFEAKKAKLRKDIDS